jgi:signal peptidase II
MKMKIREKIIGQDPDSTGVRPHSEVCLRSPSLCGKNERRELRQFKMFPSSELGMTKNSARALYLLIALAVVLLDRWTKHVVAQRLSLYSHIQVIPGFFRLTHTENTGAAFSLFADSPAPWKTALLIGFSTIALVVVSVLLWKNHHAHAGSGIGLSLIMGGALGNLWDRVTSGRVVDFLLFYVKRYQWPVFNLADSAIVVGAGLLVLEILFHKASAGEDPRPV